MIGVFRVALVEDDARFRQSLQLLIDGSSGFSCVGAWSMVENALRMPELGRAHVVLLDLHLPGMDGDEGVELILERHPSLLVLMFTAYDDDARVFTSLCRGAAHFGKSNSRTPRADRWPAIPFALQISVSEPVMTTRSKHEMTPEIFSA